MNNNIDDWIEATIDTNINMTKDKWFACPTQLFNHGQWWSIFNTQRLPEIIHLIRLQIIFKIKLRICDYFYNSLKVF